MVIGCMLGLGPLFIARIGTSVSGRDTWIAFLICGALILLNVLIVLKLIRRFPNQSLIQYMPIILGKWIGKIMGLIIILLGLFTIGVTFKIIGYIFNTYILMNTPPEALVFMLLLISIYTVSLDLRVLGRVTTILFLVSMFFSYFYFPPMTDYANVLRLFPVLETGWFVLLKGILAMLFSFTGAELILTFAPYVQDKEKIRFHMLWSIGFVVFLFFVAIVSQQLVYPLEYLKHLWAPSIHYISLVGVPVLERTDAIFTIFWFTVLYKTITVYKYHTIISIQHQFGVKSKIVVILLVATLAYILFLIPQNVFEMEKWMISILTANVSIYMVLPSILLLLAIWRKKGESQ